MKAALLTFSAALVVSGVTAINLRSGSEGLAAAQFKPVAVCCKAMTAQCLSCAAGMTVGEWCSKQPQSADWEFYLGPTDSKPGKGVNTCAPDEMVTQEECKSYANSNSPYKGARFGSFAGNLGGVRGCYWVNEKNKNGWAKSVMFNTNPYNSPGATNNPVCKRKKISSKLGCPEPKICCKAMTAECLACAAGVDKGTYCESNPSTVGCVLQQPTLCCKALTAQCLSCSAGLEVEEYCKKNPSTVGCPTPAIRYDEDVRVCEDANGSVLKLRDCLEFDRTSFDCVDINRSANIHKSHCITWDANVERCRSRIDGRFVKTDACKGIGC